MLELRKTKSQMKRELEGDLAWLRLKAERLVDSLVLTQDKISKIKRRLRTMFDER